MYLGWACVVFTCEGLSSREKDAILRIICQYRDLTLNLLDRSDSWQKMQIFTFQMSFQGRGSNWLGKIHAILPSLNGNKVVILVWRVIIHIADISTSGKCAPPLFHGVWGNFHSFSICLSALYNPWSRGVEVKKNYIQGRWCQCFSPVPSVWKTHTTLAR